MFYFNLCLNTLGQWSFPEEYEFCHQLSGFEILTSIEMYRNRQK